MMVNAFSPEMVHTLSAERVRGADGAIPPSKAWFPLNTKKKEEPCAGGEKQPWIFDSCCVGCKRDKAIVRFHGR